jgi:hypothetical protein
MLLGDLVVVDLRDDVAADAAPAEAVVAVQSAAVLHVDLLQTQLAIERESASTANQQCVLPGT